MFNVGDRVRVTDRCVQDLWIGREGIVKTINKDSMRVVMDQSLPGHWNDKSVCMTFDRWELADEPVVEEDWT